MISSTQLRIGMVPYINALPFSLMNPVPITFCPPSQLNRMIQTNLLDLALTSSLMGDTQEYSFLTHYGIAATEQVLSVNLYSPVRPEELTSIALDPASFTSIRLLEILYAYYWEHRPHYVNQHAPHEGYLLIGDAALDHIPPPNWLTIDLCSIWHQWTQLPFLFALFVYRSSIDMESIQEIEHILSHSLSWSEQHPLKLVSLAQSRANRSADLLTTYYRHLHYRLTEADWAGFRLFQYYHQKLLASQKYMQHAIHTK